MVTFNRAKNVGLSLLIFILLFFAVLGHWEGRLTQQAIDAISVVHNPEHGRTMEYINLLHSTEVAFEIYRRRETVEPDEISSLFDELVDRPNFAAGSTPESLDAPIAQFTQHLERARMAWLQTYDMWNLDSDLTSDSVRSASELVFQELAFARQGLATVLAEIKSTTPQYNDAFLENVKRTIGNADLEVDRFLNQEPTTIRDVMEPVERILKIIEGLEDSDNHDHSDHHSGHNMDEKSNPEIDIENSTRQLRGLLFALEDTQVDQSDSYHDELIDKTASLLKKIDIAVRSVGDHSVKNIDNSTVLLNANLQRSRMWRNVLTAIGMVLAFVVSILLGRTLGARVKAVTDGTEALAAGEFTHRIPVPHDDQLGQLARSFNQMAETLQSQEVERELHLLAVDEAVTEAQFASASKSEFLASMSHEIRTPINGVLGAADLLLRESLTRSQRHLCETISRSGKSLLGIINDILDFSKIEAGHMEIEETSFNLVSLVEDVAEMAAPSAHQKGLELTCIIPPTIPGFVFGDELRLRQVLTNLVSNAVKFTDTGEIIVEVSASQTDVKKARYRFSVRDTGIGISEEAQAVVFNSFTQADRSTTRNYGGTGLGLAISHQLVALLGGELGLTSELGEGAEFSFSLPLKQDRSMTEQSMQSLEVLRALLVSGNPSTLQALSYQLQVLNVDCTTATSGNHALTMLKDGNARPETGIDAVFIDGRLDDMGGLELAHLINSNDAINSQPQKVALCLVGEDQSTLDARLMAELNLHLTKPVRLSTLYNCLLEITDQAPDAVETQLQSSSDISLKGHVLLAEDHAINQQIITRMLQHLGCEVSVVDDGAQALEALKDNKFDLILMDCDMPVMDGLQATRQLRAKESNSGLVARHTVIALTANALVGDRERCIEAGMDDYLTKPIDIEGMAAALIKWLPESVDAQEQLSLSATKEISRLPVKDHETLNPAVLDEIVELGNGDYDFLRELVEKFAQNSALDLVAVHDAIASADSESVRKAAHRLKSSSANLGAAALANGCGKVELAAKQGAMSNASKYAADLDAELARTLDALNVVCRQAA